jgi:hypothetical protein
MEIVGDDLGMGPLPSKGEAPLVKQLSSLHSKIVEFLFCRRFFLHLAKKASEKRELERDLFMLYVSYVSISTTSYF